MVVSTRAARLLLILSGMLDSAPARAQGVPAPPGPYVVDVRGASSGLPQDAGFFPPLAIEAPVPSRGTGFDVGAHVYFGRFRGARLGFGANFLNVRGNADPPTVEASSSASGVRVAPPGTRVDLRTVSPQLSFNFGTIDGWSYLSGGVGFSTVIARTLTLPEARQESGSVTTINAGGGARWFVRRRLAVGFDVRLHRVAPGDTAAASMLFSISAGISLR
jgi:hypothetical protein